ncbi:tRNA (guanine(37)-N1)-methyltransferase 1 [Rhododendron vialii]|uniref:tRNA (guanine(37)-N1)-methyltransferase 1 n=1 Tax=Rhododendron vialii TaxID=182163 RepID=UPI00265FC5A2|nr:tRNA (guanine(37)-N1)-methyltransferase 1 [Rhododendron vialii]
MLHARPTMLTKFLPLSHSLTFPFLSPPRLLFPKPLSLSLIPAAATLDQSFSYGPSLRKGHRSSHHRPPHLKEEQGEGETEHDYSIDRDFFTRAYDIAALRVPSDRCFDLESRLRGHLLNWPRIRNIARVPGDEMEDGFKKLISDGDDEDESSLVSLDRRIVGKGEGDGELLSPVLYRDKLARTFNSRGFVRFRNLARISRPPKKKKRGEREGGGRREREGVGKSEFCVVEVVEEEGEEDMSGLLGEEFRVTRKWRGSTRLLLLDEKCAGKRMEELPEAIKVVLNENGREETISTFELVRCKLTLFYDYWQMNEILEALLPEGVIVPSAFETVGHIAHLNLRDEHFPYKKLIAKVVLDKTKPKIQTVVNKIDAIHNDFRTMQLEVLAGNRSLVTTVVENGLRFHLDLATVYWNSRLATERQRLLNCFTRDDVVCDVFAGVGPIAISAARKVKHVYANDLNPHAVEYLERNCVHNKLERKLDVFNMDGRRFIDAVFASRKSQSITQVVMNLPNDAAEYLDVFKGIFSTKPKDRGIALPKIHVYGFSKCDDPEFDFHERIRIALSEVAFEVEMNRVRLVAPGKWMLCASFILPESVAFAKATTNM